MCYAATTSNSGLYIATKALTFASYFCKNASTNSILIARRRVDISGNFHSVTDHIFHFKFRLIIRFFKLHNLLTNESFKSHTFNTWKLPQCVKTKHSSIFFSQRINWLNQLIVKLACLMQHRRKYQAKILMKVRVLKLKSGYSKMSGSQSFCGSLFTSIYTIENNIFWEISKDYQFQ